MVRAGGSPAAAAPTPLRLAPGTREALARRVAAARPLEACGLLVGREDGDATRVLEVVGLDNVALDRRRAFRLDPVQHLRVEQEALARGFAVVGVWHSHPDGPARPSESDRRGAWPGWSYLVAGAGPLGSCELRSWRLDGGGALREQPIEDEAAPTDPAPGAPPAEGTHRVRSDHAVHPSMSPDGPAGALSERGRSAAPSAAGPCARSA